MPGVTHLDLRAVPIVDLVERERLGGLPVALGVLDAHLGEQRASADPFRGNGCPRLAPTLAAYLAKLEVHVYDALPPVLDLLRVEGPAANHYTDAFRFGRL